jgi:hypothetical protein
METDNLRAVDQLADENTMEEGSISSNSTTFVTGTQEQAKQQSAQTLSQNPWSSPSIRDTQRREADAFA